jgi:hypothetical protein
MGCSASTSSTDRESVGKTEQALDPRQVITPTQYTITLSEVDVTSAVEPSSGICGLWTPDTGYVDWAELGVQVNSQNPVAEACTLTDSNGNPSAATGTALTQCGPNAAANDLFFQNKPLSINFGVTGPNDVVTVALALDNIEGTSQTVSGDMKQGLSNDSLVMAGNDLQLAGNAISVVGTIEDNSSASIAGGVISTVGSFITLFASPSSPPSGSPGYDTATSCIGGLLGNPVQSATTNQSGLVNDGPPPDTMWFTLTPAVLEALISESANTAGTPGCPAGICNEIDFYPSMTGLGPPAGACYNKGGTGTEDTAGDPGFPGNGPAYDYGCSSNLRVRLTVTRNWSTGPASFAKSPDMGVVQDKNVSAVVAANQTGYVSQYLVSPSEVLFDGNIPVGPPGIDLGINNGFTVPIVVSRDPSSLDAFYIGGGYLFAGSDNPATKGAWQLAVPIDSAPGAAAVTAAARSPSNLDVFYINTDGNLYDEYWTAPGGWSQSAYDVTKAVCFGSNGSAVWDGGPCVGSGVLGGGVAAVALSPWNLNVFYVGNDGGIWNPNWEGSTWNTYEIFGPSSPFQQNAGVATPGSAIAAVARTASNVDVYYIGTDGGLWTSSWQAGGTWGSWEIPGTAGLARAGTPISAVSRQPGAVDVVFEGGASTGNSIEWASWQYPGSWTVNSIPGTSGQTPSQQSADAISIVAPNSFSLQAFYLNAQAQIAMMTWQDPTQCNAGGLPGCTSMPTSFAWSAVKVLNP